MNLHSLFITIQPLDVENSSQLFNIASQVHTHPMSLSNIKSCFGHLYHNIGLFRDDELLGFAIVHQVVDEATLIDICVAPNAQGNGFGKRLISEIKECAKQRNASFIQLEVRASNLSALGLYLMQGFVEIGRRKDYYPTESGREDAVLMELRNEC